MVAETEQLREIFEHANLKPGEPDALSPAPQSDAVEAVVPIAASDQRQSMRTSGRGASKGASAMFEQRTFRVGSDRNGEALCLLGLERSGFKERNHLVEDCSVAGDADVMRRDEGKPKKIVTNPGADASA